MTSTLATERRLPSGQPRGRLVLLHGFTQTRRSWDRFVDACRTPHVLFRRGFVEYHADRFEDASVVVEDPDRPGALLAVVPARRAMRGPRDPADGPR